MPDPCLVDLSYRGLKLAQRTRLDALATGAFVVFETPLPVGSRLVVELDGRPLEARVTGVVEQEAGGKNEPGMRVAWVGAEPALVGETRTAAPTPATTTPDASATGARTSEASAASSVGDATTAMPAVDDAAVATAVGADATVVMTAVDPAAVAQMNADTSVTTVMAAVDPSELLADTSATTMMAAVPEPILSESPPTALGDSGATARFGAVSGLEEMAEAGAAESGAPESTEAAAPEDTRGGSKRGRKRRRTIVK